jgi:hypothetical protein
MCRLVDEVIERQDGQDRSRRTSGRHILDAQKLADHALPGDRVRRKVGVA